MKFNIEIEEIFQRVVQVEANSIEEAIDIVEKKWNDGEIVLDSEDFMDRNVRDFPYDYDKSAQIRGGRLIYETDNN